MFVRVTGETLFKNMTGTAAAAGQRLAVRGCRDVKPAAAAARRALVARFGDLARRYGFAEVELPVIERAELFLSALGSSSDVVTSELFRVTGPGPQDPKDRVQLALRPEGTAGAARAFVPRVSGDIARIWYAGPMFRYERPQKRRLRQFTQVGVECLGDCTVIADLDCIALAHEFISSTSAGKAACLHINTLGTQQDRKQFNNDLALWLKPRYAALSEISRKRFDTGNCMRILDSKLSEDQDAMSGAPTLTERLSQPELDRFQHLQTLLSDLGMHFVVDTSLVRGLEYYTSTAFEFIDLERRAICAGGRYEGVQGAAGVGFAAGLERLEDEESLADDSSNADHFGGVSGGVAIIAMASCAGVSPEESLALDVTRRLRQAGTCAVSRVISGKMGKAIGRAVREGALAVILIGTDEVSQGVVQVKLIEGSSHETRQPQRTIAVNEVTAAVDQHLRSRFNI
jgi:histidyl-tRNA synthetase